MKFSQLLNRKDSIKEKAQTAFVRASKLFDERWYASRYQDVFKKLKDPARHYYLVGWKENRNPSENFDTASYLRQYPECGICPIVFEHNRNDYADLAVCIIVKDEAPYIKEWLDYHLMVGVKRFYIYDNESFDNLKQVLLPYIRQGVVIYQYYPGEVMQLNCYRDFLKQYGDKNEWVAFIDADEFIIPMENATIPEFLADYKEYPAVGVNWVSYDSNGHKEKPKGGVMENYTRVHYDENMVPFHLIKSIVRPQEVSKVVNPHFFLYKGDKLAVNENKEEIGGDLSERAYISPFSTNKIRINHYYCKSRAEAETKVLRGSSDRDIRRRKSISAKELNFPDYKYDYTAYKFVLQLNPEKAKIEEIKMAWLRLKNAFIEFKHTFNPSPLYDYIDEEWYFKQYPDAKKSGMSAAKHYVNIGWRKGYNPSKKFNTEFYLNKYKDVAKAHICPLLHYLNSGKNEGRLAYETDTVISATEPVSQPLLKHLSEWGKSLFKEKEREYNELWQNKAYFDENWYLKQYPDAKESGMSAKKHYDTIGWLQGYNPSAKFKTNEYLKQYPECKICPIDFEYNRNRYVDLAVCAIMKNEVPYVKEWLDYHQMVGVKRFYIYDNESSDDLCQVLLPYIRQGIVVYKNYPGEAKQMPAYNEFIKEYGDKNEWVAFIDADEFIIPMEKESIPEFLADYKEYPGVGINWVAYDSNGHKAKPEGGVLENYTRVHYDENLVPFHQIKSIVQPSQVDKIINPHYALFKDNKLAVNENKQEIGGSLEERAYISPFSANKIRINHYFCKSEEEYKAKIERGRAPTKRSIKRVYNQSQVFFDDYKYDYSAYRFVAKLKPEIAQNEEVKYIWQKVKNAWIAFKHKVKHNPLYDYIDEKWYFEQYPDAKESGMSAAEHYMNIGWRKGYNPCEKFDTNFYLKKYKDVARMHVCPLLHYLNSGKKEGRLAFEGDTIKSSVASKKVVKKNTGSLFSRICCYFKEEEKYNEFWNSKEYFDEEWYIAQYPEANGYKGGAKAHYRKEGWQKEYNPSEKFNTEEYLKQYPECKICPLDFEYNRNGYVDLSIVAIMRNEAPYVKEWIDYHSLVGVKRFYIYDNESTDNMKEVLTPYIEKGVVVYKYYPGCLLDGAQCSAYNECIRNYKYKTKWLAIIDVDEFIVPTEKDNIPEFLKDFNDYPGIVINWMCFDSNKHVNKPKGGVLENYIRCHFYHYRSEDTRVKCIVNPRKVSLADIHFHHYVNESKGEYAVDSNKSPVKFNQDKDSPLYNKIRINHYWSRSQQEFLAKVSKWGASGRKFMGVKQFYDFNDGIYDYKVYRQVAHLNGHFLKEKIKYMWSSVMNFILYPKRSVLYTYIDEKYYQQHYPEYKNEAGDAITHYMTIGWKKGYNPSEKFDTKFYLEKYPDIAASKMNPLLHYVMHGLDSRLPKAGAVLSKRKEGIVFRIYSYLERICHFMKQQDSSRITKYSPYFDEKWYFKQYPDAKESGLSAEDHYNTIGWKKGYNPSKCFDTVWYLTKYKDIAKAGINPFLHYINSGRKEGRKPLMENNTAKSNVYKKLLSYYFDYEMYCDKYLNGKADFIQALEHYNTIGWKKGYNPSTHFDTNFYLKQCPYLTQFDMSPLQHLLKYGYCCRCMPINLNYDYYKRLPANDYKEALEEWYRYVTTKELNLDNPQTFNEKVQWLKLYASTPIKTLLADKYLVRDWIKEKIGEKYLIPLLGVYDSFDEIDFDKLPNQFVMKGNHGCAFNIIVKDKSKLDIVDAKNKLSNWLKLNFAYMGGMELQYKNMPPKIVIEKFIENKKSDDLNDYKFFCFDGKVKYVQVISERINGTHKVSFYDTNWKKQSWWDNDFYEGEVEKPKKFDEMVELADKLCKGFNFVRVDLYYLDTDDIYFGEMTFTPASGVMRWSSNDINLKLGNMIKLPKYAYDVNSGKYYKFRKKWYSSLLDYFRKDELDYIVKHERYNNILWNDMPYFDEKWYIAQYPEAKKYRGGARAHYCKEGWRKEYNPSEKFSTEEYLKQYPECKICPLDFEYNRNGYVDLSIVAIMRNEGPYVKEWIDYHRLVGVKRFYIYDNESTDNLKEVLTPYIEQGVVVYKYFPGRKEDGMQTKAYTECIADYKYKTEWLAIIDADEFIVPVKNKTIPEFLSDYKEYPGVVVNWVVYDSNGHTDKPEGGVLENYARIHFSHNCNDDRMIKSIVNPRKVMYPEGHCSIYNNNECAVTENFTRHPHMNSTIFHSGNKIRINHYWTKSKSEYLAKIKKPRCNGIYLQETENHYNFKDFKYDYAVWKYVAKLDKKFLKEFFKYIQYSVKSFLIGMKHPPVPDINDYVDEKYYSQHYPEYKNEAKSALVHYMSIGWKRGYNPSDKFDTNYYLNRYHDIAKVGMNPLLHYVSSGYKEGRMPKLKKPSIWSNLFSSSNLSQNELYSKIYASKLFDKRWYLRHYSEVSKQHIDPLEHYLTTGWKKGYNPSNKFDTNFYLNTYPDIKQADINPLIHYLNYGKAEGRNIADVVESRDTVLATLYKKLFVKKLNNPKISVIVASYNYEQYIRETLDSLINQTYKNFEVVVVDDGSKDNSVSVVKEYVNKYDNVFLFTHENGKNNGLVETVKLGISKSTGEYIAFCESDDYWAPTHLEEKVKLINKYFNPEIVVNDVELFGKKDLDYEKYLDNNLRTLTGEKINVNVTMQKYNVVPTFSCTMIRKDILTKCDFDSVVVAWTDWWIYRQILSVAPLYYIPQKLTFWRLHDSYNSSEKSVEYMRKYNEFIVYSNAIITKHNKNFNSILENNENCQLIKSSDLFDEKWYLEQYKDVRDMHISASYHYNMLGWKKGYNPSSKFDTEAYLNLYPDVKELDVSPLVHYIKHGKKEGRSCISCIHKPEFYNTKNISDRRYKRNILLVSHMLNHTGAPVLLKQVAELLNKKRYKVTVLSPKDGDLRDEILQVGADVIIDPNAFAKEQDCEYLKKYNFAFCICNTYINALIYSYLSKFIPSILWIHDNLNEKTANLIMPVLSTSKDIYAASKLTKSYMVPYNKNIKILTYPANDVVGQISKRNNDKKRKTRIAVCAALQPRKGQDIFIEAVKMLPDNIRENAEFLLLGEEGQIGYKEILENMCVNTPEIKFVEAIKTPKEYHNFIDGLDVLCCPSREDPCPLVVLDAFMHGVPVIVSDHVGQKDIIRNKKDGYIFKNEDINELSQILNHLIVSKEYLLMRNKSRAIFERNFSDKTFLNDLFKIMEEKCAI